MFFTESYNPFKAAVLAAVSELSSAQAQQFYQHKAQQDIQRTMDAVLTVGSWVYQLAQISYGLGVQCRAWCEELEVNARSDSSTDGSAIALLAASVHESSAEGVTDPWELNVEWEPAEPVLSSIAEAAVEVKRLAPAQSAITGPIWNPDPKDIHAEVFQLQQLQPPAMLVLPPAPTAEQPKPRRQRKSNGSGKSRQQPQKETTKGTGKKSTGRGRTQSTP